MEHEQALELLGHAYQHVYDAADKLYDPRTKPFPILGELGEADQQALAVLQGAAIELSAEIYG